MKKKLTLAQQTARAEKKAKFAALVKRVGDMSVVEKAELASKIGVVNCAGHTLSVRNQILIAMQVGDHATIVGGFRQWLTQGRCVRKGEHGAAILFPRVSGTKEKLEPVASSEGEPDVYFLTGTVFDISQTDIIEAEHPVAVVSPEVAEAFGMANLPNVRVVDPHDAPKSLMNNPPPDGWKETDKVPRKPITPQVPAMAGMSPLGL